MLQATLDLLTMKAFRPDIRNYQMPFGKREINESILGICIHRAGATLCCLNADGDSERPVSHIQALHELCDDELREVIVQYARRHYLRYAIGLLSYDFTIEQRMLSAAASAQDAQLLRDEPYAILGNEIENGCRYSIIRQPQDSKAALVFTYKQSAITRLESLTDRSPISFLQIGGGIEWALSNWLAVSANRFGIRPLDLVVYDAPTITIFQIDNQSFSPNTFCRTDTSGVPARESTIIRKGLERYLRSGSHVAFLDVSLNPSVNDSLISLLEDVIGTEDLTIENYPHPFQLLLSESGL